MGRPSARAAPEQGRVAQIPGLRPTARPTARTSLVSFLASCEGGRLVRRSLRGAARGGLLVPCQEPCDANHYQNAENADRNLHWNSGGYLDFHEMGGKCQEHPETEDFERMLSAQDRRLEPG